MSPELDELLKRAMALPPEERAAMANSLLESLDETEYENAEAAWDNEIKRRVDDIRSGRVKTIPGEQVLRKTAEQFPDVASRLRDRSRGRSKDWFAKLDQFNSESFHHPGSQPMLEDLTTRPRKSRSRR